MHQGDQFVLRRTSSLLLRYADENEMGIENAATLMPLPEEKETFEVSRW